MARVSKYQLFFLVLMVMTGSSLVRASAQVALCNHLGMLAEPSPGELPREGDFRFDLIEEIYGSRIFSTRRQNRFYRTLFTAPPERGQLALSLDFPILTLLNNRFENKRRNGAIFSMYKDIFFRNLEQNPVLSRELISSRDELDARSADYGNVGLIFEHDTPEIRERIERLQQMTADDFYRITHRVPELRALETSEGAILRNHRSWVLYGFGSNPLEATTSSRLARYHPASEGITPIRHFRNDSVQQELRQKFIELERRREEAVSMIRALTQTREVREMLTQTGGGNGPWVLSERLWNVLRGIGPVGSLSEYRQQLRQKVREEFHVTISDNLIQRLQDCYHLMVNFQPRVHQSHEMDINIDQGNHGAVYVDARGQTARNLFRMASELANVASSTGLSHPNLVGLAMAAVRRGQDEASRKFLKMLRTIKRVARLAGFSSGITISGDEIVIQMGPGTTQTQFRSLLATLADEGVPVRLGMVADGAVAPNGAHVSQLERLEKALRQRLKASRFPVADWNHLVIGVRYTPLSATTGNMEIYLAESRNSGVIARARPLIEWWLADPAIAAEIIPAGSRVTGVTNAHNGSHFASGMLIP